jgi:ABC-type microcin C transport system duplicated ATPase subunit YejF
MLQFTGHCTLQLPSIKSYPGLHLLHIVELEQDIQFEGQTIWHLSNIKVYPLAHDLQID